MYEIWDGVRDKEFAKNIGKIDGEILYKIYGLCWFIDENEFVRKEMAKWKNKMVKKGRYIKELDRERRLSSECYLM